VLASAKEYNLSEEEEAHSLFIFDIRFGRNEEKMIQSEWLIRTDVHTLVDFTRNLFLVYLV
jgi:hypothetical protein